MLMFCAGVLFTWLGQCGGLTNPLQSILLADEGNISVSAGSSVNFTCKLDNDVAKNNIVWRRGYEVLATRNILITADSRMSLTYTDEGSTLLLTNTSPADSNEYVCQVSLIGELVSASFFLDILVPPSIVSLPGDGRVIITEGMNLDLLCNTTGNPRPNVTWSRDGAVVRPGSGKCGEGCVRLEGVMSSAGGMYTCRADNGISPAAVASTQVVVQYPPVLGVEEESISTGINQDYKNLDPPVLGVEEDSISTGINQKVVLTCIVDGEPLPQVTWQFQGDSALPRHEGFRFNSVGRIHTLTMAELKASQMGNYTCVAQNSLGTKKTSIEVHGRPGPVNVRSDMSLSTRRKHTLIWTLVSHSRILEYRLLYRLLPQESSDRSITNDWTNVIIPGQQQTSSTVKKMEWTLQNLLPDTRYECIVQARNEFGWSEASGRHKFSTLNPSKTGSSVQLLEKSSWTSEANTNILLHKIYILVIAFNYMLTYRITF